jgi:alpha-1,2-mannosyltransferase
MSAASRAAWLNAGRVRAWASIFLAVECLAMLYLIAGTHGMIVPLDHPVSTDFASFYAAGTLAQAGTPALAYDQAAHYAAEQQATEIGIPYQFFFYPPPMLLLCRLFAPIPYLAAYLLFQATSLGLLLIVARGILQRSAWMWLAPLLAFPPVFYTLGLGQNAFLTAALFGGGLLLVDRRPLLAGLLFGLLCYKPHFGLLIPVALLAGRHWRAAASAALTVAGVLALTWALFGLEVWQAFLASIQHSAGVYQSGRIEFAGMVSVFGAARTAGVPPTAAYLLQAAVAVAAAVVVGRIWFRGASLPVRAAALLAGTLLAVPLALIYDLMLAAVAALWLIRDSGERGFLPWEKPMLLLGFLIPLASRSLGLQLHVPLGFLCATMLLALSLRHAARERLAGA